MDTKYGKRCKRRNSAGDTHFLTFSCFRRQPFLVKDRSRHWVLDAIRKAQQTHDFSIWAWVIMPEHVHLLIRPRQEIYSISGILKSIKQPVTNAALKFLRAEAPGFLDFMRDAQPNGKVSFRFWQRGGGYDTNLWTGKHITEKVQYIHENPMRRGLVSAVVDWEWSSARDRRGMRDVPLLPLVEGPLPW
jgi:putative transposase